MPSKRSSQKAARRPTIVVVGGGIAGLTAAWEIKQSGYDVEVLEPNRVGGLVGQVTLAGVSLDTGAESFATRGGAVESFVDALGLHEALVAPNPRGAKLRTKHRNVAIPQPSVLGIPAELWSADTRAAIGPVTAAMAVLRDRRPLGKEVSAASLGAVVEGRMGAAVVDRLVRPIVGGVYSSDPYSIDIARQLPGIRAAILREGSLAGAVASMRARPKPGSAVRGLNGGMHRLVDALTESLGPDTIRAEQVSAITRNPGDGQWVIITNVRDAVTADGIILATDGPSALSLCAGLDNAAFAPLVATLPKPQPVHILTMVVDAHGLDAAPVGTGVLVAPEATDITAKALTHSTAKWSWLARRFDTGMHVLRLSYGDPLPAYTNRGLLAVALADASKLTGVKLRADSLRGAHVEHLKSPAPTTLLGYADRLTHFRSALADHPELSVTGTWVSGTGLASVIPHARATAQQLLQQVVAH